MSVMLYKAGSGVKIWGKKLQTKVVSDSDVEEHLNDGWHEHPYDVPDEIESDVPASDDDQKDMGEVSDGYHTFNELYAHRVRLFSTLMNAFPNLSWWSRKHSDGEEWEGWILAGIDTPDGAATYHLPESEIENLPADTEIDAGKEWDGHTADDVLNRLLSLRASIAEPEPEPEEVKPKRVKKDKAEPEATEEPQAEVSDESED